MKTALEFTAGFTKAQWGLIFWFLVFTFLKVPITIEPHNLASVLGVTALTSYLFSDLLTTDKLRKEFTLLGFIWYFVMLGSVALTDSSLLLPVYLLGLAVLSHVLWFLLSVRVLVTMGAKK